MRPHADAGRDRKQQSNTSQPGSRGISIPLMQKPEISLLREKASLQQSYRSFIPLEGLGRELTRAEHRFLRTYI